MSLPRVFNLGLGVSSIYRVTSDSLPASTERGGSILQGSQQAKTAGPPGRAFWPKAFATDLSAGSGSQVQGTDTPPSTCGVSKGGAVWTLEFRV